MEETIVISKREYEYLILRDDKLTALEGAGVDNWDGYCDAMEWFEENKSF